TSKTNGCKQNAPTGVGFDRCATRQQDWAVCVRWEVERTRAGCEALTPTCRTWTSGCQEIFRTEIHTSTLHSAWVFVFSPSRLRSSHRGDCLWPAGVIS